MEIIVKSSDVNRGGANIYGEMLTEIIRCKDCTHWQDSKCFCGQFHVGTPSDGFCYMAKRKTGTDCSWK